MEAVVGSAFVGSWEGEGGGESRIRGILGLGWNDGL